MNFIANDWSLCSTSLRFKDIISRSHLFFKFVCQVLNCIKLMRSHREVNFAFPSYSAFPFHRRLRQACVVVSPTFSRQNIWKRFKRESVTRILFLFFLATSVSASVPLQIFCAWNLILLEILRAVFVCGHQNFITTRHEMVSALRFAAIVAKTTCFP